MQTIIAPTDFSEVSLNAVRYAADMANALNANLLILHATEFTCTSTPSINEIQIENRLTSLKNVLIRRTNNKIKISSKQVDGIIENELIKICEYKNPAAVVMATKGAALKGHLFIRSVTIYLARSLRYPVIVVPEDCTYEPVSKFLLATDLEDLNGLPLEKIVKIVTVFKAQLDILHVYNDEDKFEVMAARMCELTNYLKKLNPQFHFVKDTDVHKAILLFALKNNSDIILTFPKKHSVFYRSQSKKLIFNSPFVVMTMQ